MADLQAEVQAATGEMVDAEMETGLQVAVCQHGRVANGSAAGWLAAVTRIDRLIAGTEEYQ
jgi:hypothetical protein